MIPIGARVMWREDIAKTPWVGTVTAHLTDKMVECDGKGGISVGLLAVVEGVGEMYDESDMDMATHGLVDREELDALRVERDALQALVVEQCEAMALMAPAPDPGLQAKVEELREWAANVADYLEGYLLATYGRRWPLQIGDRDLRELAAFVFEGV